MDKPTIPPKVQSCKHCSRGYFDPRSQFCSIKCRIEHNDALDARNRPVRRTCASDGCDRPVRTKRAMYCKECYPKKKVQPVKTTYSVPPGQYACYWCDKPLKAHQVRVNPLNEDHADTTPGNFVACCDRHYKGKRYAMFFMAELSPTKLDEFQRLIKLYKQRR